MSATLSVGETRADASYTVEQIRAANGLSKAALSALRRQGLPILRLGKRSFVLGRDWIAFLEKHGRRVGADGTVEPQA